MPEEGVQPPAISDPIVLPTITADPKMWYQSSELWAAIIALSAFIAQGIYGNVILPADIQASILAILMFILRSVRKPAPIAWTRAHLAQLKALV